MNNDDFPMLANAPGGDWFLEIGRTKSHSFLHNGGVLILPGTKELVSGFTDPLDAGTAGGRYINYENGVTTYGNAITASKDFALTGMAAVCSPADIEVGNFVWQDTNKNGRQDPGEPALQGVIITLKTSAGVTIATATTNASGNYIFSSATGTSTSSNIYGLTGLMPLTNYILSIDNAAGQTRLAGLSLTTANITTNTEDQRDNDATLTRFGTAFFDPSVFIIYFKAHNQNRCHTYHFYSFFF